MQITQTFIVYLKLKLQITMMTIGFYLEIEPRNCYLNIHLEFYHLGQKEIKFILEQ